MAFNATRGVSFHPGFNAIANKQLVEMGVNPPRIRSTPAFAPLPQRSPTQPAPMKVPAPDTKGNSWQKG